jgi:hypothetical protein
MNSPPTRNPTRNVPVVTQQPYGHEIANSSPTLAMVPPKVQAQKVAASQTVADAQPVSGGFLQDNLKLLIAGGALLVVLILGIVGIVVLKPAPTGLLMLNVPEAVWGTVKIQVNGKDVVDEKGQPFTDFPQMLSVPLGKVSVLIKAPGYDPVQQTVDVVANGEPAQLTKELKKKAPSKE